jgi:tRNA nucleotidyltransferase (CCA-adding enzyme)
MSTDHVGQADIVRFADERVNLKREDAKDYRDQVNRLRDRLEQYLKENPDFALRKMLLSGSLAKGTSLKSLSDIDVAVYVSCAEAPADMGELIPWIAARLRQAFPNFKPEQVVENPYTITVLFSSSGLKVDVVPVLYDGDSEWRGYLVSKDTGEKVLTCIPLHLDFIRRRKTANKIHYAQVVRLLKQWVKIRKAEDSDFRFKSFMIELVVAHLADRGLPLDDYPEALAKILAYIASDGLRSVIVFDDHYKPSVCPSCSDPIRMWDPVNHENNIANRYTEAQREAIIEAALEAGDAIDAALYATTKSDTLRYWRKVFGTTFEV